MFVWPEKITYALPETIGNTDLFVGRKKEFDFFLGRWYDRLIKNGAQSQAVVARRKKGKTAFLQRFFNILWSCPNGGVIPFYYSIPEKATTLAGFSKEFFAMCASCYLSFMSRKPEFLLRTLKTEELPEYLKEERDLRLNYQAILASEKSGDWDSMWSVASRTPFEIAATKGIKVVQILDEFQNINEYVYNSKDKKITSMSGTYLDLAEKKEAPMVISGSEVHGLMAIIRSLTGRFRERVMENLPEEEAKEAIRRYTQFANWKTDDTTLDKIWQLTQGDPLYIRALAFNESIPSEGLIQEEHIVEAYSQEITRGDIFKTWGEYIAKVFYEVNQKNAKRIMLYLFSAGGERSRSQIRKDLKLEMTEVELENKLRQMLKADLISLGSSESKYVIAQDKTYELVFRRMYQDEIDHYALDVRKGIHQAMGKASNTMGKYREFLIKEAVKKPFNLKDLAENGIDLLIRPKEILERQRVKIGVGEREIDLIVKGNQELWIDIKDTKSKFGKSQTDRWLEIKALAPQQKKPILFAVYSQNGYTQSALERLKQQGVIVLRSSH